MDSTLVNVQKIHHNAFQHALHLVFGIETKPDPTQHSGMPMPLVFSSVLHQAGLSQSIIDSGLDRAVQEQARIAIQKIKNVKTDIKLPGVTQLLSRLRKDGNILGLATGTIEKTGKVILEQAEINHYFVTSSFGDEADSKAALFRATINKAISIVGQSIKKASLVVIGDSPQDIVAGKENGALTIAVATGSLTCPELNRYQPDFVFEDLSNTELVINSVYENN